MTPLQSMATMTRSPAVRNESFDITGTSDPVAANDSIVQYNGPNTGDTVTDSGDTGTDWGSIAAAGDLVATAAGDLAAGDLVATAAPGGQAVSPSTRDLSILLPGAVSDAIAPGPTSPRPLSRCDPR